MPALIVAGLISQSCVATPRGQAELRRTLLSSVTSVRVAEYAALPYTSDFAIMSSPIASSAETGMSHALCMPMHILAAQSFRSN